MTKNSKLPIISDKKRLTFGDKEGHIKDWIDNGLVVFRGLVNKDKLESHKNIIDLERSLINDGKNEFNLGDRIGQLHQKYENFLDIINEKILLDFITEVIDDEPCVMGSLNFERGSEQGLHSDCIFFWPEPSYQMVGVWVALEDISPNSGPLTYVPGSHKLPFYFVDDLCEKFPEAKKLVIDGKNGTNKDNNVSELGNLWTKNLNELIIENSLEERILQLRAGDVVVWHSQLVHGGSRVIDKKLSRKASVFHFIGQDTSLYTFEQFMLHSRDEIQSECLPQGKKIKKFKNVAYLGLDYFVSYSQLGQEIHNL